MYNNVVKSDIHSTDTHGYSEVIFAVTYLLGLSYAPRIKNLKKQTLYTFKDHKINAFPDWKIKPEKYIDSLESKNTFEKEMKQAGFSDVNIHLITHSIKAESAKSFWNDIVKGSAPIAMLKNNTDDKTWIKMEKLALNYIEKSISQFPTSLTADSWIGVATKK